MALSNLYDIPIFIIARDRFHCLKNLVSYLKWTGYNNIHILDNGSTYEPLLGWYDYTDLTVYRVGNLGQSVPWQLPETLELMKDSEFVVSDPDLYPIEQCPTDIIERAIYLLKKYPQYDKIGPSLEIDDIPDHYPHKDRVIKWEGQFWGRIGPEKTFQAPIDTTFAVHRADTPYKLTEALRMAPPYTFKHTSWYLDFDNLPEDEQYYINHLNVEVSNWSKVEVSNDHII